MYGPGTLALSVGPVAGGLLYAGLSYLVLQPLRRVTRSIERFAADPESAPNVRGRTGTRWPPAKIVAVVSRGT